MTDDVYRERARLVALLAAQYPAVRSYSDPNEPDWSVVYVDSPAGQLSWHISPADVDLFEHVPLVEPDDPRAQWDGHTTVEKYLRVGKLISPDKPYADRDVREPVVHVHLHGSIRSDRDIVKVIQDELQRGRGWGGR